MELNIVSDSGTKKYYESVSKRVEEQFNLALKAKAKQVDTSNIVECVPVTDLADRAEKLVGPKGIALRYREVLKENNGNRMQALFQIFREIIEQKWFAIPDDQKRVEQAIKTALVLVTEGVVVSPLDGLPEVRISKNFDNSKYIDVFFAGPIRAAGGSATVIPLILGDYARKLLALDRYKPTEEEVERYVEEIDLYQKEILSRQYKIPQEEIRTIIRNCPVCINGIPSEEREVSVNRDLPRMPSNRVRNGVALVVSEGIALKAMKILSWARELNLDWEWLESFKKVEKGEKITELKAIKSYLDGMAVGRPLLAYPSKFGGFRLRYGRGRNTAAMGKAINPALMILLDEFIAVGTHIRIERPGKAAQLFPCDSIDGPTVLLKNGTVMKVDSIEEAEKIKTQLEKILFLGDILITVGDFRKTAHPLAPSPYVEEWWQLELEKALKEKNKKIETGKEISFNEAVKLSKELGIPLHPKFIYYYTALKKEGLELLVKEFKEMQFSEEKYFLNKKDETKKLLEKIGVPHSIEENKIVFEKEIGEALRLTFGAEKDNALLLVSENILESLSNISEVKIKNKAGTFIGARMGRPEQAKPREMKGNPHVLFPIGLAGGATRSINKAIEKVDYKTLKHGVIEVEVNLDKKKISGHVPMEHFKKKINLRELLEKASENLNERPPNLIKGVKGLFNDLKEPEALEKGILRAKHGVHVFRDGTSRFELLNAPLTHFTAKELNLSIKKVKELGYEKDVNGKEIESDEQIIELFPQDIVINETGGEWLVQVSKFIDDLLEKFYKTEPYYKAEKKEDLIGELVIGLAPHTSAGIVGRVLGYSKSRLGWGHPYFIMTKRRNCVHPETNIIIYDGEKKLIENTKIEKLIEKAIKENPGCLTSIDGFGTKSLENEKKLYALSLVNGKLKWKRITKFFKGKSDKGWLKITTATGRKIKITPNHKMAVYENNRFTIKEAKELKLMENLPISKKLHPPIINKKINLIEEAIKLNKKEKEKITVRNARNFFKNLIKKNGRKKVLDILKFKTGNLSYWYGSMPLIHLEKLLDARILSIDEIPKETKVGIKRSFKTLPIELDSIKLARILGYYAAEGHGREKLHSRHLSFRICNKEMQVNLKNLLNEVFGHVCIEEKKTKLTVGCKLLYFIMKKNWETGKNAHDKRVPKWLFTANETEIIEFLSAYFDGDGSIVGKVITFHSVSKNLLEDIANLLLRLEIFSRYEKNKGRLPGKKLLERYKELNKPPKKSTGYRVKLGFKDSIILANKLILVHKLKKEKFEKIKNKISNARKTAVYNAVENGSSVQIYKSFNLEEKAEFILDKIKKIEKFNDGKPSYCLDIEGKKIEDKIVLWGNQLLMPRCDGDQDSIMLLLDPLLNFSEKYLSGRMGGRMDTPLVFTTALNPTEIDDEVYEMETCKKYSLELYEKSQEFASPYLDSIPIVKNKLGRKEQYTEINFTHSTKTFDEGPKQSMYTKLKSMEEKIKRQANLQGKIKAVKAKDALERVLNSHFFPDIIGNARAFSRQKFRCTKCNAKYRRIPLRGYCIKCKNGDLILTIAQGSVRKYLGIAKQIINEHGLSNYLKQRIELSEKEIDSIFKDDKVKQQNLFEFV